MRRVGDHSRSAVTCKRTRAGSRQGPLRALRGALNWPHSVWLPTCERDYGCTGQAHGGGVQRVPGVSLDGSNRTKALHGRNEVDGPWRTLVLTGNTTRTPKAPPCARRLRLSTMAASNIVDAHSSGPRLDRIGYQQALHGAER